MWVLIVTALWSSGTPQMAMSDFTSEARCKAAGDDAIRMIREHVSPTPEYPAFPLQASYKCDPK